MKILLIILLLATLGFIVYARTGKLDKFINKIPTWAILMAMALTVVAIIIHETY